MRSALAWILCRLPYWLFDRVPSRVRNWVWGSWDDTPTHRVVTGVYRDVVDVVATQAKIRAAHDAQW